MKTKRLFFAIILLSAFFASALVWAQTTPSTQIASNKISTENKDKKSDNRTTVKRDSSDKRDTQKPKEGAQKKEKEEKADSTASSATKEESKPKEFQKDKLDRLKKEADSLKGLIKDKNASIKGDSIYIDSLQKVVEREESAVSKITKKENIQFIDTCIIRLMNRRLHEPFNKENVEHAIKCYDMINTTELREGYSKIWEMLKCYEQSNNEFQKILKEAGNYFINHLQNSGIKKAHNEFKTKYIDKIKEMEYYKKYYHKDWRIIYLDDQIEKALAIFNSHSTEKRTNFIPRLDPLIERKGHAPAKTDPAPTVQPANTSVADVAAGTNNISGTESKSNTGGKKDTGVNPMALFTPENTENTENTEKAPREKREETIARLEKEIPKLDSICKQNDSIISAQRACIDTLKGKIKKSRDAIVGVRKDTAFIDDAIVKLAECRLKASYNAKHIADAIRSFDLIYSQKCKDDNKIILELLMGYENAYNEFNAIISEAIKESKNPAAAATFNKTYADKIKKMDYYKNYYGKTDESLYLNTRIKKALELLKDQDSKQQKPADLSLLLK